MQEFTKEVWRSVDGYSGLYEVSSEGRVRSLDKLVIFGMGRVKFMKGKVLNSWMDRYGYLQITLHKDGKRTNFTVHRLVASAFPEICGQFRKELDVDHKNTVRTDNRAINLHWVTRSENNLNPITRQRKSDANKGKFGKLNPNSKPIIQYDLEGNFLDEFECQNDAARKLNIRQGSISACCKGRYKTAGGFKWTYKEQ